MAEFTLALLGPPAVGCDGKPVTFDTRKAVALLALLAVTQREHSRERLAGLLWPDVEESRARSSLRRTLSVTAAAMSEGLIISRGAVSLRADRVSVDMTEFQKLATATDPARLEQAAAIYRDDFMAGFTLRGCPEFEDWQVAVADRARQDLARALERLVAALGPGQPERALEHARRWLSLDPLHEPAHQALIRLLAWTGQRSKALRQYRTLVRILDTELAVRPLPETTRLYEDVRAGRLEPPPKPVRAAGDARPRRPQSRAAAGAGEWPFAGRDSELNAMRSAWRAVGPAGRVIAIVGEAGCGKSRLVEEFRREAANAGSSTLTSRCHDGESGLPLVSAADLLRSALAVCPGLPARLPVHMAAIAGRLAPDLGAAYPGVSAPPLDSPVALTRLYEAIGEALRIGVSSPRGRAGVVIVEDVQWADRPSLDLLGYLMRRLAGWPVLLLLTWSGGDHADRLRALKSALSEAGSAGLGSVLEPPSLGAAEIAALLRAAGLPGADVGKLLAETRGLPMLVREYVAGLRSAGSEGWWPPASVRDLLRRRLQDASEPVRQLLSTASVLGSGWDADVLRAVSGRGETETVEALDEALDRFLLTEVPPAGERVAPRYDFPYEALRKVVYDSATLARRRLLHSRAADALARGYEHDPITNTAALIAGHLESAGRDGEAALWWWRAAARARDLYAHAEAYTYLRRAKALGYPQDEVCVALGDVLTVLGRYREALAEFEAAAGARDAEANADEAGLLTGVGPPGDGTASIEGGEADRIASAAIEHRLAEVYHRLGDWVLADAHLKMALDELDPADTGRQARLGADRALLAYRRGATAEAAGLAGDALAAARSTGEPAAIAQALNVLGMLDARLGRPAAAEARLRESLAEARALGDPGPVVAALNNLARLLTETGGADEALGLAQEALARGRELGDQHHLAALHTNLADVLHATGHADDALGHLKAAARGFASVDTGGPPRPEVWTLVEW
ncbi:MAG TPA: AAA family ATPase [Streptosporangiaceae bacterium]|nr:AAA family ATPase [Streptosporangiaceae bacterium]